MGSTFNFSSMDVGLNTGNYYGSGYSTVSGSSGGSTRNASSTNINRITRDIISGYSQNISLVEQYLNCGDLTQAMLLYDETLEEVKKTANNYGFSLTDSQISSILNQAYGGGFNNDESLTFTQSVTQDTHSPFVAGLLQGVPILGCFAESFSDKEALSKLSGAKTRTTDKITEYIGSALSGAAAGAAIGALGGPIGPVVGALIGLGQNLIKGLIDKN